MNSYSLLYQIAQNTAGIPPIVGDGAYQLACKIAQNTGTPPKFGEDLYDLFYRITGNTAGTPPRYGDGIYDLLYKISGNTGGNPAFGDGVNILLSKTVKGTGGSGGLPASDVDADNFFTRAAITDPVQKSAVTNLTISLKSAGIWAKMRALYPLVGGTAASHSHNLKSASYQITWNGAMTHNANGVTGAGGNGDTGLDMTPMNPDSISFGVYCKSAAITTTRDISGASDGYSLYIYHTNSVYASLGDAGIWVYPVPAETDARGFFVAHRQSATIAKIFKNGSVISVDSNNTHGIASPGNFLFLNTSLHNHALVFISDGLADADVAALNTAVTTYQTALGRNV